MQFELLKKTGKIPVNAIEPVTIVIPESNDSDDPTGWKSIPLGDVPPKGFKELLNMGKFWIDEAFVLLSQRKWVISHPEIDFGPIPLFVHDFIFHYTSMILYPEYGDALVEASKAALQNNEVLNTKEQHSVSNRPGVVARLYWAMEHLQDLSPQWRGNVIFDKIEWPETMLAQKAKTVDEFKAVLKTFPVEQRLNLGRALLGIIPFAVRNLGAIPAHELEQYWFNEQFRNQWTCLI